MNKLKEIQAKYDLKKMFHELNVPRKGKSYVAVWDNAKSARVIIMKDNLHWFDVKTKKVGDVLDLYCVVKKCTLKQGLAALLGESSVTPENYKPVQGTAKQTILKQIEIKRDSSNFDYLKSRGLSYATIRKYCRVFQYENEHGKFWETGIANDAGGFEVRKEITRGGKTKKFAGTIGQFGITTIERNSGTNAVIFESFIDFLSSVEMSPQLFEKENAVIIHGVRKDVALTDRFKSFKFFCDADADGSELLERMKCKFEVEDCRDWMAGYKDVNEFLMSEFK